MGIAVEEDESGFYLLRKNARHFESIQTIGIFRNLKWRPTKNRGGGASKLFNCVEMNEPLISLTLTD